MRWLLKKRKNVHYITMNHNQAVLGGGCHESDKGICSRVDCDRSNGCVFNYRLECGLRCACAGLSGRSCQNREPSSDRNRPLGDVGHRCRKQDEVGAVFPTILRTAGPSPMRRIHSREYILWPWRGLAILKSARNWHCRGTAIHSLGYRDSGGSKTGKTHAVLLIGDSSVQEPSWFDPSRLPTLFQVRFK